MLKLEDFLEQEKLSDLLSTATYGNGWPAIESTVYRKPEEALNFTEDEWANDLLSGKALMVYDLNDDDHPYKITLDDIKKGLMIMKEKYPYHWNNLVNENEDLETCDTLLQCTVFGELVYG